MSEQKRSAPSGNGRGAFYRFCREWHGYFSAFAFAALAFFAVTGITLNHPEWFAHRNASRETQTIMLSPEVLHRAEATSDPSAALAAAITHAARVRGAFKSGEVLDGEALLRFEGVSGNSTATVDIATGTTEIVIERADAVSMLNDLHRGKNAGAIWKALIDVAGALVLTLSLIGFVLFFSLRFRIWTSLALTAAGLAGVLAVFFFFVP